MRAISRPAFFACLIALASVSLRRRLAAFCPTIRSTGRGRSIAICAVLRTHGAPWADLVGEEPRGRDTRAVSKTRFLRGPTRSLGKLLTFAGKGKENYHAKS